jgi:hypothetical protein
MKWNNLEDNLIDKQNKKRLFSLINKLPLLYEIVILEHYFDNKTINEIAKKYKKSRVWIGVIKNRSLNFISEYMKNDANLSKIKLNDYWNRVGGSLTNWKQFDPQHIRERYNTK